jgi:TPR repeat protein
MRHKPCGGGRRPAEHGDTAAEVNLGTAYSLGAGVPRNYSAAVRWYTKAADQGFTEGQRNLAFLYHSGQGVPKDDAVAVRWYTKSTTESAIMRLMNKSLGLIL